VVACIIASMTHSALPLTSTSATHPLALNAATLHPQLTVLGLSRTGCSTAAYMQAHGTPCFLSESLAASPLNASERERLQQLGVVVEMGGHSRQCFTHANTVVVSPGIPPSASIIKELALSGKTLISDVELAWQLTPQTPWVGITGTNGKTTTTTLLSAILTAAGHNAPACGNIGLPFFEVLAQNDTPPDVWVAELSSYQLDRTRQFKATVGMFLNLTPDHLDWHGGLEAYQKAKFGFLTGDRSPEVLVYRAEDPLAGVLCQRNQSPRRIPFALQPALVANATEAITLQEGARPEDRTIIYRHAGDTVPLLAVNQLAILGNHNIENVMAAAAAALALGVPAPSIAKACLAFTGVPHRLEYVATVNGCPVYNDSKATNPEATLSALFSFAASQPVVLMAGGRDKLGPLDAFAAAVCHHVAHVVVYGEAAQRFEQALRAAGYTAITHTHTLQDAVDKALAVAHQQPVVFSPACASFDMFKNFEERGDAFKKCIKLRVGGCATPTHH
jgi:UDP-N-acetylmuramoylalanine--D-glutamate ligase